MSKKSLHLCPAVVPLTLLFASGISSAQSADCRSIVNDAERLACYDAGAGRATVPPPAPVPSPAASAAPVTEARQAGAAGESRPPPQADDANRRRSGSGTSVLADRWDLDGSGHDIFALRPYQPIYILPVTYTNSVNSSPSSPAPGHTATLHGTEAVESKFQFSVKAKAVDDIFGDNGDLWLAYTQSSRWQVYNEEHSRPFRETNYEPEAMLVFRTNYRLFGFNGSLAGIGFDHQSNGRALPLSRSWNRVIARFGFERDDWTVMVRPWWRIPESKSSDDNPGIENYIGRGEITVAHAWRDQVFTLQARHSLRSGENSRGSAQLGWTFPITGGLKGYAQLFSGYGESLIDYNHRQTVIGFGVSIADWY